MKNVAGENWFLVLSLFCFPSKLLGLKHIIAGENHWPLNVIDNPLQVIKQNQDLFNLHYD